MIKRGTKNNYLTNPGSSFTYGYGVAYSVIKSSITGVDRDSYAFNLGTWKADVGKQP